MRYFNGFSLKGEEKLFSSYLIQNDFTLSGFSYGAQRAFEYVYNHPQERVERLILLSPAFFQTQKRSFIRTQLRYYAQDSDAYIHQFLANIVHPSHQDVSSYLDKGTKEELEALLSYEWDSKKIAEVLARGVTIEVYLGGKDKIINSDAAFTLFSSLTTTYLIKDTGHILAL